MERIGRMDGLPETRPSLLIRIRDPRDTEAWDQFVELYGTLIYQFGRKRGLQDADAADLTQTVLQAVIGEIRRLNYDPLRGTFRGWLFTVVRNQFHKALSRQKRMPRGTGDSDVYDMLAEHADSTEDEAIWQREYELQLFRWAMDRCRTSFDETSWQAFWQTAVEGKNAADVAAALAMTVGAVYTAKSRVLDRIKRAVRQLQTEEGLAWRENQ
jgi:RNA polymerase sigma factor (sigma-70 family)